MASKRVLIIDDERLVRKTTELLLRQVNMEAISVASGAEGIEAAKKEQPDLILLDLVMPDMDGWQVLSRLKADPASEKIPVIVFTAGDFSFSDQRIKQRGAIGVCRKPFQLQQLLKIIKETDSEIKHE